MSQSTTPTTSQRSRRFARPPHAPPESTQCSAPGQEPQALAWRMQFAGSAATRSKIGQVKELLARVSGATLAELVEATGWQPHTTRAALTGLRKKGHPLRKDKRGEAACYFLANPTS